MDEDVSIFWDHLDYLCGDVSDDVKVWVRDWLLINFNEGFASKSKSAEAKLETFIT